MPNTQSSVYVLPLIRLTKVSDMAGDGLLVDHQVKNEKVKYWRRTEFDRTSRSKTYPKFPLVLNDDGSPWEPAVLWLLDKAQASPEKLSSLLPIAQALRDYKVFLDELGLEWNDFSSIEKFCRPTYLYKTHVEALVNSGHIKPSTASRRMSTVIGFYRFAQNDRRLRFKPANAPWVERTIGLQYLDNKGFKRIKEVATTDLRVRVPSTEDPLSVFIGDSGKLKPMTVDEQKTLIKALQTLRNTEFSLMHYIGLLTGAREMTVMTLRLRDFLVAPSTILSWPYKVRCGPGTGIDTKFNKPNVHLNVSQALYRLLHVYAVSERAQKRRVKSRLGESSLNYLFLTRQGNPYYEGKDDRNATDEKIEPTRRTSPQGQSLRGFITKYVLPEMRKTLPNFHYKFHDTRATFGMNWVDHVMCSENAGSEKYHWAMDQLRQLMWHKNLATTEKYLKYRRHLKNQNSALQGWSSHLLEMIASHPHSDCQAVQADIDG